MANETSGADGSTRFDGWEPGDRSGDTRVERRWSSYLAGLGGGGREILRMQSSVVARLGASPASGDDDDCTIRAPLVTGASLRRNRHPPGAESVRSRTRESDARVLSDRPYPDGDRPFDKGKARVRVVNHDDL
jgi:hypothetical protein